MITRRSFFGIIIGLVANPTFAAAAGDHPSLVFMRRFAKDMFEANRAIDPRRFYEVIRQYADVDGIANYSLGQYKPELAAGLRSKYYMGVTTFMARYFSDQSRDYRVAKYEIGEPVVDEDKNVIVPSKVYLVSGASYNVAWALKWIGGRYRVADAKVLGFSMTYMQRGIFTSFLAKRKGDISQLVTALNR